MHNVGVRSDEYLRAALDWTAYPEDCVAHAMRVAELLLEEGRAPWIGRVRDVQGQWHGPLIPRRFEGTTWTTHYVACTGREVFDPIAGEARDVDAYALEVFGKPLTVELHVSVEETAQRLREGTLRERFRVYRTAR